MTTLQRHAVYLTAKPDATQISRLRSQEQRVGRSLTFTLACPASTETEPSGGFSQGAALLRLAGVLKKVWLTPAVFSSEDASAFDGASTEAARCVFS